MHLDDTDAARDGAARRPDRFELFPTLSRKTSAEVGRRARADMRVAQTGAADRDSLDILRVCGWVLIQREFTP